MALPLLEIDKLRIELPTGDQNIRIIDDVSLELRQGEVLGLIGESGAGKSLIGYSIINLLTEPLTIASGEIRLRGDRIDNLNEQQIALVRGRKIGL